MTYQHTQILDGDQLIASNLTIKYQFGEVSMQTHESVRWHGFIMPPNTSVQLQKQYTLKIPAFSECQIATKSKHSDGQIEFEGIGAEPQGVKA